MERIWPGGTSSPGAAQVTRTARSGSLATRRRCAGCRPRRLSATTRSIPTVVSRTRTRLGTASSPTGGSSTTALVRCCSVTRVSTLRVPSAPMTVRTRDTSVPGSGAAALAVTRTVPEPPGARSRTGGSKPNRTASSGSEPPNLSCTARLLRVLSACTRNSAVSPSRRRSSRGSARSATGASTTGTLTRTARSAYAGAPSTDVTRSTVGSTCAGTRVGDPARSRTCSVPVASGRSSRRSALATNQPGAPTAASAYPSTMVDVFVTRTSRVTVSPVAGTVTSCCSSCSRNSPRLVPVPSGAGVRPAPGGPSATRMRGMTWVSRACSPPAAGGAVDVGATRVDPSQARKAWQ